MLEKRAGLNLMAEDVFVNIAGGITVTEPAADLSIVAAVASSLRNRPVRPGTAVFGEVGLAGEVRGIRQAGLRVKEAAQLGFGRCVMPQSNRSPTDEPRGLELIGVTTVTEALDTLLADYVGAAEAKQTLIDAAAPPYIALTGRRGGSAIAAATINALANALASDRESAP